MSFSEYHAFSTRADVFVLEGMQVEIVAENDWTTSSLSFSSDLVRGVHARASVERRRHEKRGLRTWEVWRAPKRLELLSAAPQATITPPSCMLSKLPKCSTSRHTHADA